MNRSFNSLDAIFILRPLILIPVWNFLLIGNYWATKSRAIDERIISGLLIYTAIMGGIYILNQITDIETDRINKKLFILSEGYMPLRFAVIEMILLWTLGIAFSLRFGKVFFFFIILSLLIGVFYSLPPVKLKGRPILDTLSNGIGYGIINFTVGWLIQKPFEWSVILKFLPYFLSISAVFINTTIVDIEGDKRAGEKTTAVFLGSGFASIVSTLILVCAIFLSILQKDIICLIPSAIALPIFLYVALKKGLDRRITILSFRLAGVVFTIITGYLYPVYLIFLLVLFVIMRIYYKFRFGITYPTLSKG